MNFKHLLKFPQILVMFFSLISTFSANSAGNGSLWLGALGDTLKEMSKDADEQRKLDRQKELLEHRYKLENERLERAYKLEQERADRIEQAENERKEQNRRQDIVRQQQRDKAIEDKKAQEAADAKRNAVATGTGFFIASGGYLVTNHHVIEEATDFAIRDYKGRFFKATVIARDANRDLALLKVNAAFPALAITNSESVSKGQRVLAVGYPQISIQGNESKVTDGIISSFSGVQNDDNWFQISVPIQGGNSGGPLVTESGGVVGVVVATANVARFFKMTGNLPQNVNYAIKSKVLLDFLKNQSLQNLAVSKGKVSYETVDASTVLVIAKNGLIDVSYTISPEQRAQEARERMQTVANEAKRQKEEKLAEQSRIANSKQANVPKQLQPCKEYRHNCFGEITSPNGEKYVGEFKNNKFSGQGTLTFANGNAFVGGFKDENNGKGTLTFANGDIYVGELKERKYHGHGVLTFSNGGKYSGEFISGKFNGQGTLTSPKGVTYFGDFKDGKPHGSGTATNSNGEKFVGEFTEGKRSGKGIAYSADGTILKIYNLEVQNGVK
jgi:S1-C subfamily serine protease